MADVEFAEALRRCDGGDVVVGQPVPGVDDEPGLDVRKLTLSEITFIGNYTYTPVDLQAAIDALHGGALGDLAWVEQRPLAEGADAFADLDHGRTAAAKVVLLPR